MEKVFISYSHADSNFVDRLVQDLRLSEVAATYDKWLLRVGDSIIQKISEELSASTKVIAVLSPTSIDSNWVKRELALAMTGEVNTGEVTVLPALLTDCTLPPILSDKFYADFRRSYYHGLRKLLEALRPTYYTFETFVRKENIENAQKQLADIIDGGDRESVYTWLCENGFALAVLFGHLWAVSEALPRFGLGTEMADFFVINGQSGRYELSLIALGNINWSVDDTDIVIEEAQRLSRMLRWCRGNMRAVRHTLAIRMASAYGARQIEPPEKAGWVDLTIDEREMHIDAKLIFGRRKDYGTEGNKIRAKIFSDTARDVDIVSYDRVLEAVGTVLSSQYQR